MYKLANPPLGSTKADGVFYLESNTFIPFDPANTDYQKFKKDIMDGAELQDADGNVMTAEATQEFVKGLA